MNTDKLSEKNKGNAVLPLVIGSIIADLEARVYSLSLKNSKMKVGDFKNLPEVKDIMTAIAVLEKYYR